MPPFLEVLTRCYRRPHLLRHNRASIEMLKGAWLRHTFLPDDVGRGIGWSYTNMAAYAPNLEGLYIWILDDDDLCIRPTFYNDLLDITEAHNPDVIMVKMDHGPRGILPNKSWGKRPVQGDIGCSAYVVRREVWQAHAKYFSADYAGDFSFIASIFAAHYNIRWYNVIASRVQQIGLGKPEQAHRERV